ncbi:uncharacterized protein LOC143294858 isoform X2 [Babylonia areolata]|uniref:uncharacterized protein LOC143294858 isoform X2 n=1 Tax=Babylonia areolata TaxID=304850 RepID=UPI003FD1957F
MASLDVAGTLNVGRDERDSAKQKRRHEYKQDLELQIKEKDAARQRERLQDMNVNASGYLDPEKRPDRFKPLGGVHWLDQREKKSTERVRPYHTLFLYDRGQKGSEPQPPADPRGVSLRVEAESAPMGPLVLRQRRLMGDNPAGIQYHPATFAAAGVPPNNAVDQAYNFFGARDLGYGGGGGGGSIVQPISIPVADHRPIIVHAQGGGDGYHAPRFNPFHSKGGDTNRDYQSLLLITQSEKDRIRRDNEEFQRRLRQELEEERRKLNDQENEARRRLEELRREAEERRKEAERNRREAERLKKEAEKKPATEPAPRPASKKWKLYYDMDDYRLRLIEERKKIEELLKAGKPVNEAWDLKVVRKPPRNLPPTPKSADRANRDNVNDFNHLKHRDQRREFRSVFPDMPFTNRRLEQQQEALLRQQQSFLSDTSTHRRRTSMKVDVPPRRAVSRPNWMDRAPTPFPHVLRKRDRLYTSHSEGDLDRINRRNREREQILDNSGQNDDVALDELKLRHHRPSSTETLADDTWLRPSSTADI